MENIATASRQEVFDFVVTALLEQGRPSVSKVVLTRPSVLYDVLDSVPFGGSCRYRSIAPENGAVLKCGIGHLIGDVEYSSEMEGRNVLSIASRWRSLRLREFAEANREFIRDLQRAHDLFDSCQDPTEITAAEWLVLFKDAAATVAGCYELSTAVLNQ